MTEDLYYYMMEQQSKDPLHGKRLDAILEELVEYYRDLKNWVSRSTSNALPIIRASVHL
jgi:uncharacterized protein (DUF2132 family)